MFKKLDLKTASNIPTFQQNGVKKYKMLEINIIIIINSKNNIYNLLERVGMRCFFVGMCWNEYIGCLHICWKPFF